MNLTSNTVLITGGTSGIGFELAKALLELGNTVIITGRDLTKLERAQKQLPQLHTFQSDAQDPQSIHALYENVVRQFPNLNILVNNAGIMHKINLHHMEHPHTDLIPEIETNFYGPIRMVKQFLPQLKSQPSAAILNVTSALAFVPFPSFPIYSATKAGLHSFTQSLRVQLNNSSVKVFELAPPLTETPLIESMNADDLKGSQKMDVHTMVSYTIKGLQQDRFEIRPGQSNILKLMSRIAPQFILKQLSKATYKMLAQQKVE